jgi:HlyD family secretion protein
MDNTIMHNIAYTMHKEDIDIDRVIEASKLANLDQFITTLPNGYMTKTGEKGIKLSGGQKQRIGIARALYNDPTVLILDEATSSLDGLTESIIIDSIHNVLKKKTIIMIAHRLDTVKKCDVVFLMKDGKIQDSGSLDDLIIRNKELKKMSDMPTNDI